MATVGTQVSFSFGEFHPLFFLFFPRFLLFALAAESTPGRARSVSSCSQMGSLMLFTVALFGRRLHPPCEKRCVLSELRRHAFLHVQVGVPEVSVNVRVSTVTIDPPSFHLSTTFQWTLQYCKFNRFIMLRNSSFHKSSGSILQV